VIPSPIFVVGVGRSGTSLLHSMLNSHPDISCLPEIHFFRRYLARRVVRKWVDVRGPDRFLELLMDDREFARCGISPRTLLSPFLEGREIFSAKAAYRRLLELHLHSTSSGGPTPKYLGVKDPRLLDYLDDLRRVFPQGRVLQIVRDPRDVLVSRMGAEWSAGRHWLLHVLTYNTQMKLARARAQTTLSDWYWTVRYEDLLEEPESQLARLCAWLEIGYSKQMLSFQHAARELVSTNEYSWKKETLGPLLRKNHGKWRECLSKTQREITEAICDEHISEWAYEWSSGSGRHSIGRWRRWAVRLVSGAFTLAYRLRP